LDHEEVPAVVGRKPEADVLLDLHPLLLDVEERLAFLGGAGRRDADPVFVRDRLVDLLDEEAVGALERSEDALRVMRCDRHGAHPMGVANTRQRKSMLNRSPAFLMADTKRPPLPPMWANGSL